MTGTPRIVYRARTDTPPEAELNVLLAIYRRAIEFCEEGQEGGATTALDSAKGGSENDSSANFRIP
jgi:hypothetical protein